MKIAYLTGHYPKASHTFIQREISALRRNGAIISVAAIREPEEVDLTGPEEIAAAAETFYVLKHAKKINLLFLCHISLFFSRPLLWMSTLLLAVRTSQPGAKGFIWQIFYFAEAGILAQWIQSNKSDHLHNHFGDSSASVAMLAAKISKIPFSFTLHGPTEFFAPDTWRLDEKIAQAKAVICISYFARSQAMIFSDPAHWSKLKIVHCGVDISQYRKRNVKATDGTRLLFIGRLTQLKGIRILFEALKIVRVTNPAVYLTIIGDGPDRSWVEKAANEIGGVELLGYQSQTEVAVALASSDALVLPSFAEGLPVVFMEALASECPVIATRVAGVQELVVEGVSGLLVAPGDTEDLASAILTLIASPDTQAVMARTGREKVKQEFDSFREAAWLLQILEGEDGDRIRPEAESTATVPTWCGSEDGQKNSDRD